MARNFWREVIKFANQAFTFTCRYTHSLLQSLFHSSRSYLVHGNKLTALQSVTPRLVSHFSAFDNQ